MRFRSLWPRKQNTFVLLSNASPQTNLWFYLAVKIIDISWNTPLVPTVDGRIPDHTGAWCSRYPVLTPRFPWRFQPPVSPLLQFLLAGSLIDQWWPHLCGHLETERDRHFTKTHQNPEAYILMTPLKECARVKSVHWFDLPDCWFTHVQYLSMQEKMEHVLTNFADAFAVRQVVCDDFSQLREVPAVPLSAAHYVII